MRVTIVSPALRLARYGNRVTALRWAAILRRLGHEVRARAELGGHDGDLLIALHAEKSAAAVRAWRARHPRAPLIAALTGTDLYEPGGLSALTLETIALATRLVVLQPRALEVLPAQQRAKARVIVQSARAQVDQGAQADQEGAGTARFDGTGPLEVICLGHLRAVKDPLLAAEATRRLPQSSSARVVQVGAALEADLATRAEAESQNNPRWSWIGPLPRREALARLAGAHLALSTSRSEGGANSLSEALASGVPSLVTAVPGSLGLLGDDYPGAFPVGDAAALAELIARFEREPAFRTELAERTLALAELVRPERECAAWADLLAELAAEFDLG